MDEGMQGGQRERTGCVCSQQRQRCRFAAQPYLDSSHAVNNLGNIQ
jgi:hypothetical protein